MSNIGDGKVVGKEQKHHKIDKKPNERTTLL
jgi:hypothetical protein